MLGFFSFDPSSLYLLQMSALNSSSVCVLRHLWRCGVLKEWRPAGSARPTRNSLEECLIQQRHPDPNQVLLTQCVISMTFDPSLWLFNYTSVSSEGWQLCLNVVSCGASSCSVGLSGLSRSSSRLLESPLLLVQWMTGVHLDVFWINFFHLVESQDPPAQKHWQA